MSASDLQMLLRFLSQDAKIPLASAMGKVKALQAAQLDHADRIAKAKPADLQPIFPGDEKLVKQIISAAKRVAKKRAAGDDGAGAEPSPKKKKKQQRQHPETHETVSAEELEDSLQLPESIDEEDALSRIVLFTNRAPLVLAFLVVLLRYTMPEQPLSSRLSLAQAYVSITSRSRAVYLGIESGQSAEEEGFGAGQPSVTVAGKEIKVLRRWGYEWKSDATVSAEEEEEKPALWALDLEALKKSGTDKQPVPSTHSGLPVYTPQSARAYLLRSFDTAPPATTEEPAPKKKTAAAKAAEKEENLGRLLRSLHLLYDSWAEHLTAEELDKKTWSWYVQVRPAVKDGVAGWGGKNRLKLSDILSLRHGR